VVAFNETARIRVEGFHPRIVVDAAAGDAQDTASATNYELEEFARPAARDAYLTIDGADYGHPYDFRPTSEGGAEARLDWPATGSDPGAPLPASVEQHLFAGVDWVPVWANYGTPANWIAPLTNSWDVLEGTTTRPNLTLHYVPSVYLISSGPLLGAFAPPKTGLRTMTYKATLTYPENLRLIGVRKYSTYYRVSGTFALNGAYREGAAITIERRIGTSWKKVKSTTTGAGGAWAVKLSPSVKWTIRARVAGDDATGVPVEFSMPKVLNPIR
jgi:hypothetical protein